MLTRKVCLVAGHWPTLATQNAPRPHWQGTLEQFCEQKRSYTPDDVRAIEDALNEESFRLIGGGGEPAFTLCTPPYARLVCNWGREG
jgi:hypothetical protein